MSSNNLSPIRLRTVTVGLISLCVLFCPSGALAQKVQYTQNVADTTLRSRLRVDPSTLGLSLQIPFGNYPGRGGAQLPITLSYNAKVWNVNFVETRTDVFDQPIYNILEPAYGQHSVAGWTCSLTVPKIEWTGSRYIFAAQSANEQAATQFIDRSGNTLVYNSATRQWTDPLGRVIGTPLTVDPALGGMNYGYDANKPAVGDYFFDIPGVGGPTLRYTIRWRRMSDVLSVLGQQLAFRADHVFANGDPRSAGPYLFTTSPGALGPEQNSPDIPAEAGGSGNGVGNRLVSSDELFNPVVLSEILLPNSVSYKFTYNIYGEIDKVVYPTGGYERYNHARIAGTSYLKPIYGQANRGVVDQFVSADGTASTEVTSHYSAVYSGSDL